MRTTKQIIEEINSMFEDELVDEFVGAEIAPQELVGEPADSTTDELNAKTKISRALDVLVDAIGDFKNVAVEEMNLIDDADLGVSIETLDSAILEIRSVLNGKEAGIPEEQPMEPVMEEPAEEPAEEEAEDIEEIDFDDEAALDLFGEE